MEKIVTLEELRQEREKQYKIITLEDGDKKFNVKIKKLSMLDLAILEDFPSAILQEVTNGLEKVEKTKQKNNKKEEKIGDLELAKKIKPLIDCVTKHVLVEPAYTELEKNNLTALITFNMRLQIFNNIFKEQEKLLPSNEE